MTRPDNPTQRGPHQTAILDDETLGRILRAAEERYGHLLEQTRTTYGEKPDVEAEALQELSAALEELNVTAEELRVQNQALRDALDGVDAQKVHYQQLFALIPDAYIVTDVYATVLEANEAALTMLGVDADRLRGKPLSVFIDEPDRRDFRHNLGNLRALEDRVEWPALLKPRRGAPLRVMLRASRMRDHGKHERIGWIIRDTTDKHRAVTLGKRFAEEQSARIEAERVARRFRALAEASRQLDAHADIDTLCLGVAKAVVKYAADYCEILLLEETQLVSRARVFREPRQTAFVEALRRRHHLMPNDSEGLVHRALETNAPQAAPPFHAADDDGERRDLFLALRANGPRNALVIPLSHSHQAVGVMIVLGTSPTPQFGVEDVGILLEVAARTSLAVTNAGLYQKLNRANREKADFLAILSHELRTPLSAVLGYTELLLAGIPAPLPENLHDHVERIRTCSWHQLGLVEQILRYVHAESGTDRPEIADVDVAALVNEASGIVSRDHQNADVDLTLDLPAAPITLQTDAGRLRQILVNLLSNALKYTDEGAITLAVRLSDDHVYFSVADTGIGMTRDDLDHAFDPFWRSAEPASRERSGVGLGLAVSERLARSLGGDITVSSQIGVGTTFTVRLPIH